MKHVDIVRNDVVGHRQDCLGRVTSLADLGVKIELEDANLERELHAGFTDATGRRVQPHDDGDAFVSLLSLSWRGSLIFATAIHDDADCPFAHASWLNADPLPKKQRR